MYEATINAQEDEDLEQDLDKANQTQFEENKGSQVLPIEDYIKTVYYRFEK